ncbi:MarR family winged helix-turn-helix transcriptional regulator [Methanobrevibacter sp.]|uniref:MarR family winged helix-turn-helix transcriptional regulator n=1 Tax=Methanobrevibacter sp. TaxID=66852 RepID=UPI003890834A
MSYKKFIQKEVAKYDLSLIQGFCILLIYNFSEINQNDLAKGLFITKGAVTKAIKKLEEDGWIFREKQHKDKRNFSLKVSKKGEEIIPALQGIADMWESEMGFDSLNPEFVETLNNLARKSVQLYFENE